MTKKIIDTIIFNLIKRFPSFSEQLSERFLQGRYELPVNLNHYYSPLPDIPKLKKEIDRWIQTGTFQGIEINTDQQLNLLSQFENYSKECENLPNFNRVTEEGYGEGYGEVEAHLLHCMVRYFKPQKVIEVGSGVSTFFTLNALKENRKYDNTTAEFICIEPYPTMKLTELREKSLISLHAEKAQNINLEIFKELRGNDLLFIDSTHVSKVDSDVNFLYLEVLPLIAKGVLIHIHDVPFPYLTLMPDHPLFELSLLWNEPALVKAFLMFNSEFEILMAQTYLHLEFSDHLKRVVKLYDPKKHFPTSLWLRRK